MRKLLLIAGLAALAVPGLASAQPGCLAQPHDNRVAGTVVGAGRGPLIGDVAAADAAGCGDYTRVGYYDSTGVWRSGAGSYDANGDWRSAAGHYDADGNWVDAAPPPASDRPAPPEAGSYGSDTAYTGPLDAAPSDTGPADNLTQRENALERRIHQGDNAGAISRDDAEHDFDTLAGIRQFQARRAASQGLSPGDRADLLNKLDNLSAIVRSQTHE